MEDNEVSLAQSTEASPSLGLGSLQRSNVPSKIAAIASDANYVRIPKDKLWAVALPAEISEYSSDFVYATVDQPNKYEVYQLYVHKLKTSGVGYVHFDSDLCGGKGIGTHGLNL
ncbi:unnamed protein product [Aphanomyces euteiches]|nr:hypothetical protein Ae201684P_019565 [Aphanomyces euteiches]